MLPQVHTVVPAALVAHIGNEIVTRAGHGRRRLRGAEVTHVEVLDREIDDCWVLFAAILCVSHEALDVHDDVRRQAAAKGDERDAVVEDKGDERDAVVEDKGDSMDCSEAPTHASTSHECCALLHGHLVSM